jgi:hypothetical protein
MVRILGQDEFIPEACGLNDLEFAPWRSRYVLDWKSLPRELGFNDLLRFKGHIVAVLIQATTIHAVFAKYRFSQSTWRCSSSADEAAFPLL